MRHNFYISLGSIFVDKKLPVKPFEWNISGETSYFRSLEWKSDKIIKYFIDMKHPLTINK